VLKKILFAKDQKVQMLGVNKNLAWKQTEQCIEIMIPAALKPVTNHVWVLKVKN
jgi:hypothetical protein